MLGKKEIPLIVVSILVLSFAISVWNFELVFPVIISISLVIMINIVAKEISAYHYEAKIENKIWELYRYGLIGVFSYSAIHPSKSFKKPVPIGAFLPVITSVLSLGYFIWLAILTFDVKPKIARAAKRHGLYSYSEMSEAQTGYIAASGIFANLLFAVLGYLIGFPEFAKLNVFYAFFNMFPISELDGNKIFFGEIALWTLLAALSLVALGVVFFIM